MNLFSESRKLWLFIVFNLCLTRSASAVECYICSWNPEDKELESDRCSTGNFIEELVRREECQDGCEIVSMRDNDGELIMFYRNCISTRLTYDVTKRITKIFQEDTYTCDSHLCNKSTRTKQSYIILLTVFFIQVFYLFI